MEKLTEIELDGIKLHETKPRNLARDSAIDIMQEDDIETALGVVHVIVQGDRHKPAIVTYHDIGLNSTTCFQGFFNYDEMEPVTHRFCLYHINAPGQQEGSLSLPQGYTFPTMDQLAEMVLPVLQFYSLKTFIGFGVGAGANILSRFALFYPERVNGMVLINCTSSKPGWSEWGYQKLNTWYMKGGQVTESVEEYLLWHWFGSKTMASNHDLVKVYQDNIKIVNPHNLAMFIESYIKRTDLGIEREIRPRNVAAKLKTIKCPLMLVSGDFSPHLDETITMNSRLDPSTTDWMKFECGGMVLEEQPAKMTEAFRLFLQGLGYVPSLSQVKLVQSRSSRILTAGNPVTSQPAF